MDNGTVKGKVYLVGAGPGDPKLITVRGQECIQACDVIVYDRLANPRLLKLLKPGAEQVYVGKLPDRHTMKQEEINQLLVDLALAGKVVTRLKGGDPTVFGRVGEEAELLYEHGIEFEIVPGITSAIAVPAYAGIPVTHRELASSFSVITGHESPDKLDQQIYWDKVTNATGTLVFLMGVAKIGYISEQLIRHGRPADTPIALIRWGTLASQRTITGTLGDIEAKVAEANFRPPAVIVVGEVVLQREKLNWYERKPLFGIRIVVTRAREQASSLSAQIEELGGEPVEFPVIEIREPASEQQLANIAASLQNPERYNWIVFTSVNGVDYFFRHLRRFGVDIRRFHSARIAAVGPATAQALENRGLSVALPLPEKYQAEGLIELLEPAMEPGDAVLLPRGNLARDVLPEALSARGMEVVGVEVYETVLAEGQDEEAIRLLEKKQIHAITFTSSSTVTNFLQALQRLGVEDPHALVRDIPAICIGPLTRNTAEEAGLGPLAMPAEATMPALVQEIAHYFERK